MGGVRRREEGGVRREEGGGREEEGGRKEKEERKNSLQSFLGLCARDGAPAPETKTGTSASLRHHTS